MVLVHRKDDRLAKLPGRIALRMVQKRLAHHAIALRGENFLFEVLNLVIFLLLVDGHGPALFGQRLRGDVGAHIENLGQAEEGSLRVFDRVNDVIPERREARLAAEIVVGVAKLAGFQRLGVVLARASRY